MKALNAVVMAACLLSVTSASAFTSTYTNNEWDFNPDKQKHFAVGAVTGMAGYAVCGRPCGYGIAMGMAVAKEIYDQKHNPQWPHGPDLAWHLLGTIVGVELGGVLIITPKRIIYTIQF